MMQSTLMPQGEHVAPTSAHRFITLYKFGVRIGVIGFFVMLAMPIMMAIMAAHGFTASHAIPGPLDQSARPVLIAPITGAFGLFLLGAGILCMLLGMRGKDEH